MLLESQSSAQESSVGSRASSIDLSFLIRMPINQSQFEGPSYKLGQVVDLTIPLYLNIYWQLQPFLINSLIKIGTTFLELISVKSFVWHQNLFIENNDLGLV